MNYPFEFQELILTEPLLRYIGFETWWGDSGDGQEIAYGPEDKNISESRYRLRATCEESEPYSYSAPVYQTMHFMTYDFMTIYFLHELYEDMKAKLSDEEFEDLIAKIKKKGRSVVYYIESYLNYKKRILNN